MSESKDIQFDEDGNLKEEKVTHPLSTLTPSNMSLDDVKRKYYEHRKDSTPYFSTEFMASFDSSGYSIYKSTYKYSSDFDGRLDFINNNAVNGFAQNMDDSKSKYLFGMLTLLNKDGANQVNGYWIIRGDKPIREVFGYIFLEDNEWQKLDFNEETGKLLDQVFYNTDTLEGISHFKIVL